MFRDIKPENILLTSKDNDIDLKLADFGFAVKSGVPAAKQNAGTPGYIAPEILQGKPHGTLLLFFVVLNILPLNLIDNSYSAGKPVDMWSLGVVLFMLLGGYPPFYEPDDDQKTMFRKIVNAEYEFHVENWCDVTEEAKDLIRGMLTLDTKKRLTVDEALDHPWLRKAREELMVRNLDKNILMLRTFRANRAAAQATVLAGTTIAIEVVRQLSGANLLGGGKSINLNDVAVNVARKLSGTNLNGAVIEAARKRSGANFAAAAAAATSGKDISPGKFSTSKKS
jgi:serine/threonine protein kinase